MLTAGTEAKKLPYIQVWSPAAEPSAPLAQRLRSIADDKQLHASIQNLARTHHVDFITIGAKPVDDESPDPGYEILYMVRGKRERHHSPEFERELLALLDINQNGTREANIAELRAGRAHYQKLQQQLKASQDLIGSAGSPTYPEVYHGR